MNKEYTVYRRSSGGTGMVVTDDPCKLPPGQGPWVKFKVARNIKPGGGPLIGGDADEVIRQINDPAKGYYEWPQPKPEDA